MNLEICVPEILGSVMDKEWPLYFRQDDVLIWSWPWVMFEEIDQSHFWNMTPELRNALDDVIGD